MSNAAYFKKVDGALDMGPLFDSLGWPSQYVGAVCIAYADVNSDNRLDIVVHLLQGYEFWGGVTNAPSLNRVFVLTAQSDGSYDDQTSEIFGTTSPVVLPGWSRKVAVGDINGDGKADIVYALNREDGRSGSIPAYSSAKSAALLSHPDGTYEVSPVGPSNWYHSVGLANIDGSVSVLLAGYAEASQPYGGSSSGYVLGGGYSFTWNQATDKWNDYSPIPIHANTFTILPGSGTQGASIVTVVNDSEDFHQLVGAFVETSSHSWVESSLLSPYSSKSVNFVSYNGDRGIAELMSVDGQLLVAAGYSESQMIHPFPGASPVAVMKLGGARVANPHADGFYYQNDGESYQKFDFYSVTNGQLVKQDFVLIDERHDANGNFFDVMDVNDDELEDIVFYPYSSDGAPDVYINTGAGIFVKLDAALFPTAPSAWGSATSKMVDLNQDGHFDLVYTPNGVDLSNNATRLWEVYFSEASLPVFEMKTPIFVMDRQQSTLIRTFAGKDTFNDMNSGATTRLDGGAGIDLCIYSGALAEYELKSLGSEFQVNKKNALRDTLVNIERLQFSDTMVGLDVGKGENTGEVYRLYLTVLGRAPEPVGCGFWIDKLDRGILSAEEMVGSFLNSEEFVTRFGGTTNANEDFVNLLYLNLLGRDGHPDSGFNFWLGVLDEKRATREEVVVGFMESDENISNSAAKIGDTPVYQQWVE